MCVVKGNGSVRAKIKRSETKYSFLVMVVLLLGVAIIMPSYEGSTSYKELTGAFIDGAAESVVVPDYTQCRKPLVTVDGYESVHEDENRGYVRTVSLRINEELTNAMRAQIGNSEVVTCQVAIVMGKESPTKEIDTVKILRTVDHTGDHAYGLKVVDNDGGGETFSYTGRGDVYLWGQNECAGKVCVHESHLIVPVGYNGDIKCLSGERAVTRHYGSNAEEYHK